MQTPINKRVISKTPPIGLSREEASDYVGLSPNIFDELVRIGALPKSLDLGIRRRVWNRNAIDLAFNNLAGLNDNQSSGSSEPTSENTLLKRLTDG